MSFLSTEDIENTLPKTADYHSSQNHSLYVKACILKYHLLQLSWIHSNAFRIIIYRN